MTNGGNDNYTKREHDLIFQEIRDSLARIEEQVKKTNGRVTLLELWQSNTVGKISIIYIAIGMAVSAVITWGAKHFS